MWIAATLSYAALSAAVALLPWWLRARRLRRWARERDAAAGVIREPRALQPGAAWIAGTLVADEPCETVERGEVVMTDAPETIAIELGHETIRLQGEVEVALGSRTRPSPGMQDATLSTLSPGDPVRVHGRLHREVHPGEGRGYRDPSESWRLEAREDAPLALEYDEVPRAPFRPNRTLVRFAVILTLVFAGGPLALSWLGEKVERFAVDELMACERIGSSRLAWADGLHVMVGTFPGWTPTSLEGRGHTLDSAIRGHRLCYGAADPALDADLAAFGLSRLPELTEAARFDGVRFDFEEALHRIGRDEDVMALAERLPAGGRTSSRVRAALFLGDVDVAAAAARESGRVDWDVRHGLTTAGNAMCLAGAHAEGAAALDALYRTLGDVRGIYGDDVLTQRAECLLRAGDLEALEATLGPLDVLDEWEAAYYRAELAVARDRPDDALSALRRARAEDRTVLAVWLLTREGRLSEARTRLLESPLSNDTEPSHSLLDGSIFSTTYHPMLDERRLREAAETFEAEDEPALRDAAGRLYLALALRLGRRWDPRADDALDEAEALLTDPTAARWLRAGLAFHHGEPDALEALYESGDAGEPPPSWRELRGEPTEHSRTTEDVADTISIQVNTPIAYEAWRDARLLRDRVSRQSLMASLRRQEQETTLPARFHQLTLVLVTGRELGADVSREERRLEALRAMFDAQPNPRLLRGYW